MTFNHISILATALALLAVGSSASVPAQTPADNPLQLSASRTVTLTVADVAREAEWYVRVLGFHETMRHRETPQEELRRVEIDGYRVDLVWHQGSTRPAPSRYQEGYDHVSYQTPALEQDYKWLMAHGVKVGATRDPKSNALRRIVIHDPEGNEIRIEPAG
jgi:catechol 2,3-dioxygenase-like lactoylglutathione lyase family enzyme